MKTLFFASMVKPVVSGFCGVRENQKVMGEPGINFPIRKS